MPCLLTREDLAAGRSAGNFEIVQMLVVRGARLQDGSLRPLAEST
jgi:hypothetical protein